MKTPRELLLEKHAPAMPALDVLRRVALPEPRLGAWGFLREIFWPQRLVWAALAVVWAVVVTLGTTRRAQPATPVSVQEMMAEWKTNQDNIHDLFAEAGPNR